MMNLRRYYKYPDEYAMQDGVTYLETDEGWPHRMISVGSEPAIASNTYDPMYGLVLAEGECNFDDVDEVISIGKEEFDAVWNAHLAQHQQSWEAAKAQYPIGAPVLGALLVFFPQGVIVHLGNDIVGVADYDQCYASAQPEWMYPKHKVRAIVSGHHEEYQWIILGEPQVLKERVR